MPLATALLQPTSVSRSDRDALIALAEDVARVAAIMLEDVGAAGPLAAAAERALLGFGQALEASIQPRRAAAEARLRGRLGTVVESFKAFAAGLGSGAADAAAFVALIRSVIELVKRFAESATLPAIRTELAFWKALVEEDLGLGPAQLTAMIPDFIDRLRHELAAAAPADLGAARRLRLCDAALLRLRDRADELVVPDIDLEPLARALDRLLRKSGIAQALAELGCAMEGLGSVAGGVAGIVAAVQPPPAPLSAGIIPLSASAEYSWYASWLLKDEDVPLLGLSDIKDRDGFINQLTTGTGALETLLRSRFGPGGQAVLDGTVEGDRLLLLLAVVNRIMQADSIVPDVAESTLGDEIRDLSNNYESDQALLLLNRRVIEKFFGDKVGTVGSGFFHDIGVSLADTVAVPRNQVFVTGDRRFVMCDDKPIHMDTAVKWYDAPLFSGPGRGRMWFKFDHAGAPACEILAQVLYAAVECGKAVWHLVEIQPGHEAQGATIGTIEIADTLHQIFFGRPVSAWMLEKSPGVRGFGKWLDCFFGVKAVSTIATSFQGWHSAAPAGNKASFYLTVVMGDIVRTLSPVSLLNTLRDLVLAIVTLINFGGPHAGSSELPSNPAWNHRKQAGIVSLADSLFAILLISLYPGDAYSIFLWSKDGAGDLRKEAMLKHWLAGGIGMGLLSGLTGSLVAQIFAWSEDFPRFFKTGAKSAGKMFALYWVYNYLFKENKTDDGHYKPGGGSFAGYPDKSQAASPYLLPYPGGTSAYVGQGNLGLFSHNFITDQNFVTPANSFDQQTYAFDFGLDFRRPIACVRSGTIVSFDESQADSSEAAPNKIVVKHDTIDPVHDKSGTGSPIQTYTEYLHLANGGVTAAPAFGGTTPAVGAHVNQGDLIGLAGDTGMSFHNHLHLHVLMDDGSGNPGNFTVPIVFQDVSGEGVPKSLYWYKSGNR